MKKILLVCTVPALESYNIGIITAAMNNSEINYYVCVFVSEREKYTRSELLERYGLEAGHGSRVEFYSLATNKLTRIISNNKYLSLVKSYAAKHQISAVHFISQDVMLHGHVNKFKDFDLYYTVHDLIPHPAKLNPIQRLKHYYLRIRKDKLLIRQINNLVTNSYSQKALLEQLYPSKNIYYHQMPSLVTPVIQSGKDKIQEIEDICNYVLFFGRIELYKGLEVLYKLFTTNPEFQSIHLVIAGRGNIYFARDLEKEKNIHFINRYIRDEEVHNLFSKATLLVLPYHSSTQSSVVSIAYYYNIPVVGSDIEGLRDSIIHGKTGILYNSNKPHELSSAIYRLFSDSTLNQNIRKYLNTEQPFFNKNLLSRQITKIY